MAVIATKNLSSLKLYLDKGLDQNSKQIKATKTFGFVDPAATNQNVLDVANAIAALQKHEVYNIVRLDNSTYLNNFHFGSHFDFPTIKRKENFYDRDKKTRNGI